MEVRARAPHRIEFAGGGTDVAEYFSIHGGLVLNAAISRFAYASFRPAPTGKLVVRSVDSGDECVLDLAVKAKYDGTLDLAKAAANVLRDAGIIASRSGGILGLETDISFGSGLGGSSALCCAILAALARGHGVTLSQSNIAQLACHVERQELALSGGIQDQYCSALGGFSLMRFGANGLVDVRSIAVSLDNLRELEFRLLLVEIDPGRESDVIVKQQLRILRESPERVVPFYARAKRFAEEMVAALSAGQTDEFGRLLYGAWINKCAFCPLISTPGVERCVAAAMGAGALGGRIMGAGGGGHLLFYTGSEGRRPIRDAVEAAGARAVSLRFESGGVVTWVR